MEWKKRRKAIVSILLILVLLRVNSMSYVMADEYTIQTSELSEETESTEETESVDQSIVLANSVSGVLWLDENNDGILDEEEEPITDYPVYLYSEDDLSAEVQKVITDQEGKYEFSELEPGEYIVGVKAEENETEYILPTVEVTDDTTNKFTIDAELLTAAFSEVIVIAENSVLTDISCAMGQTVEQNAGQIENENADSNNTEQTDSAEDNELQNEDPEEEQGTDSEQKMDYSISPSDLQTDTDTIESTDTTDTNSISGMLWLDENTNGIYDAGEQPVSDYPVYLYNSDNTSTAIKTVTTDTHGKYKFANLEPGDYKVGIKMQENGTSYLLPLCGITDDNKFVIDWVSLEGAFTEIITIEGGGLVTDINGGMMEMAVASPTSISNGYVLRGDSESGTIIGTYNTLYDACDMLNSDNTYATYYIMVQDDDPDVGSMATIDSGKIVYLRSQDTTTINTLTQKTASTRHLTVNGTLYMQYITLDGNKVGGGVEVISGELYMLAGSTIQNCYKIYQTDVAGGGLYINNSIFEMYDDSLISGNTMIRIGGVSGSENSALGGGVYICDSTFNMYGGKISNNTTYSMSDNGTENTFASGGGVYVESGTFTMGSGTSECYINDNYTSGYGAGVGIGGTNAAFEMTTTSSYICGNSSDYMGGGVSVSYGTFNMKAGNIGTIGYGNDALQGGGLFMNTQGTFNMGGTEDCNISYNTANLGGGIELWGAGTTINMGGSGNCYITYNEANYDGGGGVRLSGSGKFTMGIGTGECHISNNYTLSSSFMYGGGGVCINNSNMIFEMLTTSCYINNNVAYRLGAGVSLLSGEFNMKGGNITDNELSITTGSGGGVYVGSGTFTMGSGINECYISNNHGNTSTTYGAGGGVYVYNGTFEMTTTYCHIRNNSAGIGGGVYLYTGTFNMQAGTIGGSGYANNSYGNGGGVYIASGVFTMGASGTCNITYNEAASSGGGVYTDSGTFNMTTSSCYIRSNKAKSSGGGVLVNTGNVNMYGGTIGGSGYANTATNGGGVYGYAASTFTMGDGTSTCNITYNEATSNGGGVYYSGIFNMGSGTNSYNISNNTAATNGGGVYVQYHNSNTTEFNMNTTNCYIKGNTVTSGYGGGVYMSGGAFNMKAGFIGLLGDVNTAAYGGGVCVNAGTFTMGETDTCAIWYNTASENGGGVYINTGALSMTSSSSYISSNTANSNGGGVYIAAAGGSITTSGGSITNNSATNGDGGGIYTVDTPSYTNIKTNSSTVFDGNTAKSYCYTPTYAATEFSDIGFSSVSLTSSQISPLHPLNNYDINCTTVKLTYDPNATYGGQGTAYGEYYVKNTSATVLDNTDIKLGFTNLESKYYFDDWNKSTAGTGTSYTAGDSFTLSADTTIYAQWKLYTCSIEITKTLTGTSYDPNKEFEITVTLKNDSGALVTGTSYAYTGSAISGVTPPSDSNITFTAGKGTIKLKHGQRITITGIPWGYTYTVEETDAAVTNGTYTIAYSGTGTLSSEGDSISETLSGNATVSITNNRESVPVSGLNGMDYRLAAAGLLAILAAIITMLWFCRSRNKCK